MLDLDPIRARLSERDSTGPWEVGATYTTDGTVYVDVYGGAGPVCSEVARHDGELIAYAPQDLSDLVAEVIFLRGAIEKAMSLAAHRWSEWGSRAENVAGVLEGALYGGDERTPLDVDVRQPSEEDDEA